jgi:hypothetical protein
MAMNLAIRISSLAAWMRFSAGATPASRYVIKKAA